MPNKEKIILRDDPESATYTTVTGYEMWETKT